MQITVADVQKISITTGQILVVFVDVAGRPLAVANTMMQEAAKFMRQGILDPTIQIIVVPAGIYSYGVIDPTTGQTLPAPNQSLGSSKSGSSGSSGSSPSGDAFDRAMKGLS